MNTRRRLADGWVIAICVLFPCAAASALLYVGFFSPYDAPWQHSGLPPAPKAVVDIARVDYKTYFDDPTGDIIYVVADDGQVYANTLFEDRWLPARLDPSWKEAQPEQCAPEWPGEYADAPAGAPAPVQRPVLDSDGRRYDHAMSYAKRCYVLFEDGSLEVWTSHDSASRFAAGLPLIPVLGSLAVAIGVGAGLLINHPRRKMEGPG